MAGQEDRRDATAAALNEVAEVADATADAQREVAATSRRLSRERERGASWREISKDGRPRLVLQLINASARRLFEAGSVFRRALAVALSSEGLSTRQIGAQFGVSHQRVSSLLRRPRHHGDTDPSAENADTERDGDAGPAGSSATGP